MKSLNKYFLAAFIFLASFTFANKAMACACGCGVLNVGTSSLIPNCQGGIAFLQYDQLNQTRNWHGEHKSDEHNHDKKIDTQTVTAGTQYMFNRDWGAAIRVPYVTRYIENLPHSGAMTKTRNSDIGDIRVNGIYSGFFENMSTGLIFGLKLPTGPTKDNNVERNQQIGTGSTDTILGAYHMGNFGKNSKMGYFAQASWEKPFITHRGYKPGQEFSAATGVYYNLGKMIAVDKLVPILQLTGSRKSKDSGWANADHNADTGYNMAFLAPGIEVTVKQFKIYADIQFPIYRQVNGTQLAPQNLYKVIVGYNF